MKKMYLLVLLTSTLSFSACKPGPAADQDPAVAKIDGQTISSRELALYIQLATNGHTNNITAEQKQHLLERLITAHIAARAAAKAQLQLQPDVVAALAIWRNNVLTEALAKKYIAEHEPTEAELKTEYDTQLAALKEYHAQHILVDSKETAETIIKQLKEGADFAKIARTQSKDTGTATKGGDLDWLTLAAMPQPFSATVAMLQKGQLTDTPVQSQFGWHIIKLEDTRDPQAPPFENIKEQIQSMLQVKRVEEYFNELRKAAKVEIIATQDQPIQSTAIATPATSETAVDASTPAH